MKPLTVWTNHDLEPEKLAWLQEQISPNRLVQSVTSQVNNLTAGGRDESCTSADIAFGQPSVDDLLAQNSLKWIHITSAGFTRYDRADIRDALKAAGITFTNSSSVYDEPCAQHALAMMLMHNRRLLPAVAYHHNHDWSYAVTRPLERVLTGQNVLIVGYGAIGVRLTELIKPFGCNIRGIRRTVQGTELVPTFSIQEMNEHLVWADHVINLLPAGPTTDKIIGAAQFDAMKTGAAFYNVGRGDTVDQEALTAALKAGQVGAAYLDVTNPEPLPANHPLWSAPNCLITPHVAGGMQNEMDVLVDHFLANFKRYLANEPLRDVVTTLGK